jgi:hypothetical protein
MINLENFSKWNINEGSFSGYKWISKPTNITSDQKSKLELKISASNMTANMIKSRNFSYTNRYWDSLKNRLGQNKMGFKFGNTSPMPKQWIYFSEKVIYSDSRPLLSRNTEKDEVLAYYLLPYNGAELDKFWVVAVWEDLSGKKYLKEMTLKTFLSTSTKNLIEKQFLGSSKAGEELKRKMANVAKKDYWTLITIIACENFSDQPQGMADVAQSIYNRYHVSGKPYGKTVTEIILSKNQYEPVTKGLKAGADWKNIVSKSKAIEVYSKTKGVDLKTATKAIDTAIKAQSTITYIDSAKAHVKTRTEFLASSPTADSAVGPTERTDKSKNNSFFWNYAGKNNYYAKNDFNARPAPTEVKTA